MVSVYKPASYASHAPYATDFSLPCIQTHTSASTDPHRTDCSSALPTCDAYADMIQNAYDAYGTIQKCELH